MGTNALVAGGAHRVGREIALDLARGGANVGISYHSSRDAAARTVAEIAELGVHTSSQPADASRPELMRKLVEQTAAELGGLDVYVHCPSAGFEARPAEQIDEELWDAAMDSTAKGFMFGAQAAYRLMREAGGGVIVALTDVAGIQPWPRTGAATTCASAASHPARC